MRRAPKTALARMLRSSERAALVLRAVGTGELLLAIGLLTLPASPVPGTATAALGAGFLGYLGYGRALAPESSCGCSANEDTPITWRAFARAAVVLAGGATAAAANGAWWSTLIEQPGGSLAFLAAAVVVLVALSVDLDRWWLLPLRRLRLRVWGIRSSAASGGPRAGRRQRGAAGALPRLADRLPGGPVGSAGPLGGKRLAHPPVLGCVRDARERTTGVRGLRPGRHRQPRHPR
ncbi:MauE/DoxX family redox-associated membrane protein [Streptomyces sp. INA 01156]